MAPSESLSILVVLVSYTVLGLAAWIWAYSTETTFTYHDRHHPLHISIGLGLATGLGSLLFWDWMTKRVEALRGLWRMLRSIIGPQSILAVLLLALSSSVAEELFFRGVMQAHLGIAATSVLFGLLHGLPGTRFGSWGAFAIIAGLVFGVLCEVSGGLLAPTVAHFTINFVNLYRLSRS